MKRASPAASRVCMVCSHRTGETICSTRSRLIDSGSSCGWAVTLEYTVLAGRGEGNPGQFVPSFYRRRLASGGCGTPRRLRGTARTPSASAALMNRSQAAAEPLTTIWPGALKFAGTRTSPAAACSQRSSGGRFIRAEEGDHSAGRSDGGFLHIFAAKADQPQAVFEAEDAGQMQGGVFAEAQAGVGGDGCGVEQCRIRSAWRKLAMLVT